MELNELINNPILLKTAMESLEQSRFLPVSIEIEMSTSDSIKSKFTLNLYSILEPFLIKIDELNTKCGLK